MAAGILPKPGSKYGPCLGGCNHEDCITTRAMASTDCRICGKGIGYDQDFFQESESTVRPRVLVHAGCLYIEVRSKRVDAKN